MHRYIIYGRIVKSCGLKKKKKKRTKLDLKRRCANKSDPNTHLESSHEIMNNLFGTMLPTPKISKYFS